MTTKTSRPQTCPICGKNPVYGFVPNRKNITNPISDIPFDVSETHDFRCNGPGHVIKCYGKTKEEALTKWNTRSFATTAED